MNKRRFLARVMLTCGVVYLSTPNLLWAPELKPSQTDATADESACIPFQFHNEDIINIINTIAAAKDVNIVLPQGGKSMNTKVSFSLDHPVTVDRAWDLLSTLLDVAGYAIKPQESMYAIVPITGDIAKEPMTTFIGTPVAELPATDTWIRYVYYFANLQVSEDPNSELNKIVDTLLPTGSKRLTD